MSPTTTAIPSTVPTTTLASLTSATTTSAATTSLPPLTGTQQTIAQNVLNIIAKIDVANSKAVLKSLVDNLELSPMDYDGLSSGLVALTAVLINNPTATQKTQISAKLTDYSNLSFDFVASQPGLQNFATDPDVAQDPANQFFFTLSTQLVSEFDALIQDPTNALTFFTSTYPDASARYTTLLAEVSARAVAKKGI